MKLNREQVRESQRAYLALNRLEAEERRALTPAERWAKIAAVERLVKDLGREVRTDDDEEVRWRWVRIKRAAMS